MRLYVETNFVLELVLGQEEMLSCQRLLALGEQEVSIRIPGYALLEPKHKLDGLRKTRRQLGESISKEGRELERSETYRTGSYTPLRDVSAELRRLSAHFDREYLSVLDTLLNCATVLPLDNETILLATQHVSRYSFSLFDASMLAAVLVDLSKEPTSEACFATRDTEFAEISAKLPEVIATGCVVKRSFGDAYQYLKHPRT